MTDNQISDKYTDHEPCYYLDLLALARIIKKVKKIKLPDAQRIAAQQCGFRDLHHARVFMETSKLQELH